MSEIVNQPLYVDYTLPPGWYRNVKQSSPGNWDVQISGHGRRFRCKDELEKYVEESGITEIVAEDVDFTIWGRGKEPPQTPPQQKTDIISVSASKMAVRRPAWLNPPVEEVGGSDEEGDGDSGIDSTPEKEEPENIDEVAGETSNLEIASPQKTRYDMPCICHYCDKILSRKDKLNHHIKTQHPGGFVSKSPIKLTKTKDVSETPPGRRSIDKLAGRSIDKLAPCPYCDKILSRTDKLNQHIKTQHTGCPSPTKIKVEKTPKLPTESKVKKKIVLEDIPKRPALKNVAKKVVKDPSTIIENAMEMAYTSADPVFVKLNFPKPLIGRKRQLSEDSIDLDIGPIYASFAKSPVLEDDVPVKKKAKIEDKIEKSKEKKKVTKTHKKIKKIKSKKGSFSCPHCDKVLSRGDKLRDHIKTKHPGSKVSKGEASKKKVQNETEDVHLLDEMLVENERKELSDNLDESNSNSEKIECTICNKFFKTKSIIKRHVEKVHGFNPGDPKPYQCSLCDKAFKTKSYVVTHEKTHTESYNCSVCGKSFKTKSYVETHEKNHTRENEESAVEEAETGEVGENVESAIEEADVGENEESAVEEAAIGEAGETVEITACTQE